MCSKLVPDFTLSSRSLCCIKYTKKERSNRTIKKEKKIDRVVNRGDEAILRYELRKTVAVVTFVSK